MQLVVSGAPTVTTVQSSLNPSLFGQTVAFRASVTQTGSVLAPEGSIIFRDGAALLGTVPLSGGSAVFSTGTLAIGSHAITAQYSGSKDADPSTSAALMQVVSPVSVALQLTATPNPAHAGETVALRLSATASDGRPINGTANFTEPATGTAFGNAPISNGVAVLPVSTFAIGTHTIVATYADPANGIGFTLATVNLQVLPFDFSLTSSGTSLDIPHSGYAEVTLTVSPLGGYDQSVHLACANVPQNALCSFQPETTAPLSGGPQKVNLIVNANVLLEYGPQGTSARLERWKTSGPMLAFGIICFGLRRRKTIVLAVAALCCVWSLQGCGTKEPASTLAGQYTITVTAQDANSRTHSLPLSVHVH